jgi:hypothetical protein
MQGAVWFLNGCIPVWSTASRWIGIWLDRLVAILVVKRPLGLAFPKNNSGRDVMIDAPSVIDALQLKELHIDLNLKIKRKRWKSIILLKKLQNNIVRMILNITLPYYKLLLQLQCVQVQLNFQ